jgi:hypothetical protein
LISWRNGFVSNKKYLDRIYRIIGIIFLFQFPDETGKTSIRLHGKFIYLVNSYKFAVPPDYVKTYTFAGGDWGLGALFRRAAKRKIQVIL